MPSPRLGLYLLQSYPADARRSPGEVPVDEALAQSDALEDLGAPVALERRYAHLGHDLDDALVHGLDEVLLGLLVVCYLDAGLARSHIVQRLERQVRVDGRRPVTQEQGAVGHLSGLSRLNDKPDARPRPLPNQVVVHRPCSQQAGNRSVALVDTPV